MKVGAGFSTETLEFHGAERVERIVVRDDATNETVVMSADLVLIAAGFVDLNSINSDSRRRLRHCAPRCRSTATGASMHLGPGTRLRLR